MTTQLTIEKLVDIVLGKNSEIEEMQSALNDLIDSAKACPRYEEYKEMLESYRSY